MKRITRLDCCEDGLQDLQTDVQDFKKWSIILCMLIPRDKPTEFMDSLNEDWQNGIYALRRTKGTEGE